MAPTIVRCSCCRICSASTTTWWTRKRRLPHFRVLRPDTRGHGVLSALLGDYSIAELSREVRHRPDAVGGSASPSAACRSGSSGSGWPFMCWTRVTQLVLANTTSRLTDPQWMEVPAHAPFSKEEWWWSRILVMGRVLAAVLALGIRAGRDRAPNACYHQSRSVMPVAAWRYGTWTRPDCCPG